MVRDIYAPLVDFHWAGKQFDIADGLMISDAAVPPQLAELPGQQAGMDWQRAHDTRHWLHFTCEDASPVSPNETANLVLLSLWIANPSKTQIRLTFSVTENGNGVSRHLDRFQFFAGKQYADFSDAHLQQAADLYRTLHAMYLGGGRLNHALLLTLTGCRSIAWSTALICHAAAAEGLLTYSRGDITRRLATVFACLTEAGLAERNAAYGQFKALYGARSDIMHGRPFNIAEAERLETVDGWQEVIRKIWTVTCSTPQLMAAMQGTDHDREVYFAGVTAGYAPP